MVMTKESKPALNQVNLNNMTKHIFGIPKLSYVTRRVCVDHHIGVSSVDGLKRLKRLKRVKNGNKNKVGICGF